MVPSMYALDKSAPVRIAPSKLADARFAPLRSASCEHETKGSLQSDGRFATRSVMGYLRARKCSTRHNASLLANTRSRRHTQTPTGYFMKRTPSVSSRPS
eukprot:6181777-Pleurochrysis_carterae.AAC.1